MPNAIPVLHNSLESQHQQEGRLISFAVANTPETEGAFAWACSNVFQCNDRIILIHVYDGDSLFSLQSKQSGLTVLHRYRKQCEQKGFRCEIVHAHGSTAPVIAEISKSRGCDLCICGSRGLNAFKRAVLGSVSSKVSQLCECPVMVIKKPRNEAGAFLQVLPRRIFLAVDPENSSQAFQWALEKLLVPRIDEVFVLANFAFASRRAIALADREETRVLFETALEEFEDTCRTRGVRSITRVRVTSTEETLQAAMADSCDMLVVGRHMQTRRAFDAALHAAHTAAFPVIVVNHSPAPAKRHTKRHATCPTSPAAVSEASTEFRYGDHSGSWRDSWKATASKVLDTARFHDADGPACLRPSPSSESQRMTKSSSAVSGPESLAHDAVLAKSSSLEALLNNLEDIKDPCISRSRRCDERIEDEDVGGRMEQIPLTCDADVEQARLQTGGRDAEASGRRQVVKALARTTSRRQLSPTLSDEMQRL